MSKKTRKKSPKSPAGKTPRAQSTTSSKTPAAKTAKKTAKATASKSGKSANKQPSNASPKASHKAASKKLKSPGPSESRLRASAGSKAAAAKRTIGNPQASEPLVKKAEAPSAPKSALAEGAKAPVFHLPRDGGDTVSLSDYSGKKLVLFFYPRADTPGCTKEAIEFTRLAGAFAEAQTAILGVSADSLKAQEAFRNKHQLAIPLVSDEKHEMLEAYGVWGEKSMYGKIFQGILRTTVLIGKDGRILKVWRNVRVDGHADEVLAAVRAL